MMTPGNQEDIEQEEDAWLQEAIRVTEGIEADLRVVAEVMDRAIYQTPDFTTQKKRRTDDNNSSSRTRRRRQSLAVLRKRLSSSSSQRSLENRRRRSSIDPRSLPHFQQSFLPVATPIIATDACPSGETRNVTKRLSLMALERPRVDEEQVKNFKRLMLESEPSTLSDGSASPIDTQFLATWLEAVFTSNQSSTGRLNIPELIAFYQEMMPPNHCLVFAASFNAKSLRSIVKRDDFAAKLRFQMPTIAQSCRFYRCFGADRFLQLHIRSTNHTSREAIRDLFRSHTARFGICGRMYRAFHAKSTGKALILYLFAEYSCITGEMAAVGAGTPGILKPILIESIRNWHFPPVENENVSLAKYVARFDLGFSKTSVGCTFQRFAIAQLDLRFPDIYSTTGALMTDGCAPMSVELMWLLYNETKANKSTTEAQNHRSSTYLPAAVQARFGAFKGMWYIDPDLQAPLACRPSMEKYKLKLDHDEKPPNGVPPDNSHSISTHWQRSFEIRRFSNYRGPSCLNRQLLFLLEGLLESSLNILFELQEEEFDYLFNFFRDEGKTLTYLEWFPEDAFCIEAAKMIRCGVWQEKEPYLVELLYAIQRKRLDSILTRGHILVPQSARLLMIADPTNELEEGLVFIHISGSAGEEGVITGDVVLGRNPAYHPGDIRKANAVNLSPKWRHLLTDVVVVPVKGERSLADMLSGGDFDGDDVWVCWDRRLVDLVVPVDPAPPALPPPNTTARPSSTNSYPCLFPSWQLVDKWVLSYENQMQLGLVSNWHMLRADWAPEGVCDPGCLAMAQYLFEMVDASKTGKRMGVLPTEFQETCFPPWWRKENADGVQGIKKYRNSTSVVGTLYACASEMRDQLASQPELMAWFVQKKTPHPRFRAMREQFQMQTWSRHLHLAVNKWMDRFNQALSQRTQGLSKSLLLERVQRQIQREVEIFIEREADSAANIKIELALCAYFECFRRYDIEYERRGTQTKISE